MKTESDRNNKRIEKNCEAYKEQLMEDIQIMNLMYRSHILWKHCNFEIRINQLIGYPHLSSRLLHGEVKI